MKIFDRNSLPAVGAGSLLTAFGVLCLVVFAMLSLSTVRSEKGMDDSCAEAVKAYYAADYQAEQIFSRLRRGEMPEEVTKQGDLYIYQCPISESQSLLVVLEKTQEDWQVLRWQAVVSEDAGTQDTLPVWTGRAEQEETP